MKRHLLLTFTLAAIFHSTQALRLEPIKYADMENWVTRNITESKIIGG
ncbi:MAG: glycoside hydrolase xylanase, partial [Bacteroides sp.]|nr:glycoside hydrolase xylanase [Bacteroides sp.]